MKVLSINTYGGSLLLGAQALGANIIGTYEDAGFGSDIQAANFPDIPLIKTRREWPSQDLSDTFVIAHPPCSAFSVQNTQPTARGIDSEAFECTKTVLKYATENNAIGIAIESVMGALGGAWVIHQQFADEMGYNLYRVLENGCMFGAQWRDRFWVVYIKKGAAPDVFPITLTPNFQTVSEVVSGYEDGPPPGNVDKLLERQKQRLIAEADCTPGEMAFLFEKQDPPHKTTALGRVLWELKYKAKKYEVYEVFQDFIGGFASGTMCYLDPNGMCPVLMGGSWWYYNGRNLSETGYKRLMGFPADYVFPEKPKNYRSALRVYLSKGVMPPIARWILEESFNHLGWRSRTQGENAYVIETEPNKIADFRIKKTAWWNRKEQQPPLLMYTEDQLLHRKPAPKPPRTHIEINRMPRLERVRRNIDRPFGGSAMGARKIGVLDVELTGTSITERRRATMLGIIKSLETNPTLDDAVKLCIEHPEVQILPTTARWHLRQLMKSGHLQELQ